MIGADGRARNDRNPKRSLKIYKNAGWNGLAYWLGKKKGSAFLPYEEAKKVVNAVGLKSREDRKRWSCNRQPNEQIYTEEDEEGEEEESEEEEEESEEEEEESEERGK